MRKEGERKERGRDGGSEKKGTDERKERGKEGDRKWSGRVNYWAS